MSTATTNPVELLRGLPILASDFKLPAQNAGTLKSVNPKDDSTLFEFKCTSPELLALMCALAGEAFRHSVETGVTENDRADLLDLIAVKLERDRSLITAMYCLETSLPSGRANAELNRTIGQIQAFAAYLRSGEWSCPVISVSADGKFSIRTMLFPIGAIGIWAASNFALAFSVMGGDTAAAIAAGCPVVFKAHSSHPATAELVGRCFAEAISEKSDKFHPGWFSLVQSNDHALGEALICNKHIAGGALTGSKKAGTRLAQLAREHGKQFFAEMSSVNPVMVLAARLAADPLGLAKEYVESLTLGFGQFCTNPGLLFIIKGPGYDQFIEEVRRLLGLIDPAVMLNRGICAAYQSGVKALRDGKTGCTVLFESEKACGGPNQTLPIVFTTTGKQYLERREALSTEVFGWCGIIVTVGSVQEMLDISTTFEGELTATIYGTDDELASKEGKLLCTRLSLVAGRVIVNAMPTGVIVCAAQNHGGPFPACTIDASSVGLGAMQRFERRVAFQGVAHKNLPWQLRDENPRAITRSLQVTPTFPVVVFAKSPVFSKLSVPEFVAEQAS